MVDLFESLLKEIIAPEFAKRGFKKKKRVFYKVTNDVLQGCHYQRARFGHDCEFEFGTVPFCVGLESANGFISYSLGWFPRRFNAPYKNHYFDYTEESIRSYLAERLEMLEMVAFPYFDSTVDSWSCYIEDQRMRARLDIYQKEYTDYRALFTLLKAGDYDEAMKYLATRRQDNIDKYNKVAQEYSDDPEYVQIIQKRLKPYQMKYDMLIAWINAHDYECVQNFIAENEHKSLIALGLQPLGGDLQ